MKTRILFLLGILIAGFNSCKDAVPMVALEEFMYLSLTGAKNNPNIKKLNLASSRDTVFSVSMAYGGTINYEHGNIEGSIEVDMSLVDAYNANNSTNYLPLPEGTYSFDKNKALIANGKNSSESLKLTVKINSINLSYEYILPVTIKSVSGGDLPLNDDYKTLYLVFEADIDEEINQKDWVSSDASSAGQADFEVGKAFDGDASTYWHTDLSGLPQWFIVDMIGFKRIDGFTLNNRKDLGQDALPKHIKFETSINKIEWQTVLDVAELPQSRVGQVLPLEQSVIARYFRVTVLSSWNDASYTYLAEVSIYSGEEPEPEQDIEKYKWETLGVSNEWQDSDDYRARKTFDDNVTSIWHTDPALGMPQWYSVDMQNNLKITGFTFVNRQDEGGGPAYPKKVKFEVSTDGSIWETALVVDEVSQTKELQKFPLENRATARYFKLTVESNWSGAGYTFVAEAGIY